MRPAAILLLLTSVPGLAQVPLTRARPAAGQVKGTAVAAYTLQLRAGEAAWLNLRQWTANLRARVLHPKGTVSAFDAFEFGPDPITVVAEGAGTFTIEIQCDHGCEHSARFNLELVSTHPAGERDKWRVQASALASKARAAAGSIETRAEWTANGEEAARLFRALGDPKAEAGALSILGVGYFGVHEYSRAEATFRRALEVGASDAALEADLLHNIAICRKYQDFPDEAVEYYLQARRKWQTLPVRTPGEGSTLSSLGVLLCDMGECNKAIEYHRESMATLEAFGDPYRSGMAAHNLGAAYGVLGDNVAAARYIAASVPLFQVAKNGKRALARALMNLGLVRVEQRRYAEARSLEKQALAMLTTEIGARADGLRDLCKVETLSGKPVEAEALCREAIELYREIPDRRGEAVALHNLGVALSAQQRWNDAAETLTSALEIRQALTMPSGLIETLTQLAQVEAARGRLDEAASRAAQAVEQTESLRARVTAEGLRTSYFAAKQKSYETYIDVLMRLHAQAPGDGHDVRALEMAERRRARTLLDMLGVARNELRASSDPALVEKQRALIRRINYLSTRKNRFEVLSNAQDKLRVVAQQLDDTLRELELVEGRLRDADPRLSEIMQPPSPSLAKIRDQLGPRDALVEYALCPERSYVWVVTQDGVQVSTLAPREQIERLALRTADLAARFRERQRGPALEQQYQHAVAALRREVFRAVEKYAAGLRLILVADGNLQLVPFAALVGPRREFVALPSAWTLVAKRAAYQQGRTPSRVAVYADPVFDPDDPRVKQTSHDRGTRGLSLSRLPFSRREAEAIESLVPAGTLDCAMDFDASKRRFLSPRMANYRYIHLSSHAILDTERPELSSIVFSEVDEAGRPVDGRVRMYEIYDLRTAAELVTLSACQTGLGKAVRGEGLVGLTRAFLLAGAKSVLVTLWPVEDEGTAVFMREFYGKLLGKPSMRPSAALRAAQESMSQSDRWKDPYYWAGFVLQGDWR